MAANPTDLRVVSSNSGRVRRASMGATAIKPGQLCKFTANLIVPAADNDKQLALFVAMEFAKISESNGILVVPFSDAVVEMAYSGTPTLGTAYGISGPNTVDATDTTNLAVIVVAVNTARTTVDVIEYQLSA